MRCEETSGSKQSRWRSSQDQSSLNLHSLNPIVMTTSANLSAQPPVQSFPSRCSPRVRARLNGCVRRTPCASTTSGWREQSRTVSKKNEALEAKRNHGRTSKRSARNPALFANCRSEPNAGRGYGAVAVRAAYRAVAGESQRAPDYKTENRTLASLVQALADSPRTILQTLADKLVEMLRAGYAMSVRTCNSSSC